MEGVARIGMPEARILLGQACTFLATAPKSNAAYAAINAALKEVERSGALPVPLHLRNAPTDLHREQGNAAGYKYPHNFAGNYVAEAYLPDQLRGRRYFTPSENGEEKRLKERLDEILAARGKAGDEG